MFSLTSAAAQQIQLAAQASSAEHMALPHHLGEVTRTPFAGENLIVHLICRNLVRCPVVPGRN